MANAEQLAILKQGVDVWNRWRDENPYSMVDLRQANLRQADLVGADLIGADLVGVDLREVHLSEAYLREANLSGVNLSGANLSRAKLSGVALRGADLGDADLSGADLGRANLSGANLGRADLLESVWLDAILWRTTFANLDLSQAIGLENVSHDGPSSISTDTFSLSKGKIPEEFLRGCGLSDWEIESVKLYNPDLSNDEFIDIQNRIFDLRNRQPLQISPLFVSYSRADGDFVDKIGDALTKKGVRYWRDIHEMKAGRIEKQIDTAIRQNPTMLLVLSEHSVKSDWVEHEVRMARVLEKETGKDVLCPIALDESWKESPWPQRIMEQVKEYNILDFSGWNDNSKFKDMFRKLIDGLDLFYRK